MKRLPSFASQRQFPVWVGYVPASGELADASQEASR